MSNDLNKAGLEAAALAWTGDSRLGLYPEQEAALSAAISAYLAASQPIGDGMEVVFDGVAKRKLDGLLERGWKISGYSIHCDGDHGLITTGGFVGWFSVAERNDAAARADLSSASSRIEVLEFVHKSMADFVRTRIPTDQNIEQAESYLAWIGMAIRLEERGDKAEARATAAEAQVAALRAALEPFAMAADDLAEGHHDNSPIWESPAAMGIDAKHLRAARSMYASLREKQDAE